MKTGIMIGREFATTLAVILAPGNYSVKASNFTRIHDENLGKDKFIVNLKAVIGKEKLQAVKEAYGTEEKIDLGDLNGLTASGNIIINDGAKLPETPMKGQDVKISVDYVENKAGQRILAVTAISVPPVAKAAMFSFDEVEAETDQALSATNEAEVTTTVVEKEKIKAI